MHEQELRKHRCCFTGHRPEKLNISEEQLCVRLGQEIDQAIEDGFTTFISGMAKGVDICAAELVLKRRVSDARLKHFRMKISDFIGVRRGLIVMWR